MSLVVTLWGTRGSIPSPGAGTVRYGGNTPCLTIEADGDRLILDAGTGIRRLGQTVTAEARGPRSISILLTHTHWDHIQGLPFFLAALTRDDSVFIQGPPNPDTTLDTAIRRLMDPPFFPVPMAALDVTVGVTEITSRQFDVDHFAVSVVEARHPGATFGYAVQHQRRGPKAIYLTDNELRRYDPQNDRSGLVQFLRRSDLLIHDAMYFEHELRDRDGWGHSSAVEAVGLAIEAECKRLVLFHHDPSHDDATLERLLDEAMNARDRAGGNCEVLLAAEGMSLTL